LIQCKAQVTNQKGKFGLTRVNIKIKEIIIIVLKLNLGVNPIQGPGHGSGESIRVDPGQRMDKNNNNYYYSFKTQLESLLRKKVWVTSSEDQRMDKNNNYYSFKS